MRTKTFDGQMPKFTRYNDGEWSALYQDGERVCVGDAYLSDEYLSNFFGVQEVDSDAYFLGRENTYENAASTLDEIEAYEKAKIKADLQAKKAAAEKELKEIQARYEALEQQDTE